MPKPQKPEPSRRQSSKHSQMCSSAEEPALQSSGIILDHSGILVKRIIMVEAAEMTQGVKVTVTKLDSLRSFPRIHRGRSSTLQSCTLAGLHLWVTICSHSHTNSYTCKIIN